MKKVQAKDITTCLWFNFNADEAISFYTSLFENSKILETSKYGDEGPGPEGAIMTANFTLCGRKFMALNGGPNFTFTEAASIVVYCDTQDDINFLWEQLTSNGGNESMCGWLKDRFGLSWQIVPSILGDLMKGPNSGKVMQSLLKMNKLDIQTLKQAAQTP